MGAGSGGLVLPRTRHSPLREHLLRVQRLWWRPSRLALGGLLRGALGRCTFLGSRTAERLFGRREAVGETVELWDTRFTVVGVLEQKITTSSYSGEERDKVVIPASTFRDLFGWRSISNLWVRYADRERRQHQLAVLEGVRRRQEA